MSAKAMAIEGKAVLVTGANRGLGQALVEEALRRGATRVYAGTRQPLVHPNNVVKRVRYLACQTCPLIREADGEITALKRRERGEKLLLVEAIAIRARAIVCGLEPRWSAFLHRHNEFETRAGGAHSARERTEKVLPQAAETMLPAT